MDVKEKLLSALDDLEAAKAEHDPAFVAEIERARGAINRAVMILEDLTFGVPLHASEDGPEVYKTNGEF